MAYGLNWFSEFADIEEKVFRVEILKRDFVGTAIEVISSGNPIKLSWSDDAANNPFSPVRTQKAEIQWISEDISGFDISDIFVIDQQEYKVRFGELDGEDFSILWEGYLVPTDCKEPYQAKPYAVDMSAICSLALMKDQYFLDENGRFVEGIDSLMNILISCLSQTKLELGIDVYIGLLEISAANPIMLSQTYIDTDGLRGMTCYEVLEGIMNSINAYITQENGRWVIKGIRELVAETITKRSFNHDGSGFTFSTVSQISTIGRTPMSSGVPNLFPTKNVDESIATPSSVITNTVSPGIAVNRLTNGTFNPAKSPWGVNLGLMDGWAYSPEPKGYRVEGEGMPDNPYRFIMIGSVKTIGDIVYRTSGASQKGTAIYNTPVITIHRDGGKDSYPNIKIVVSGAFRARDGGRLLISCRFNDGDKDYVQWLDENGNWTKAKKDTDRTAIKVTVDTPHNPEAYIALKDLPLQTFEVTSSKIPDYLDRPGGWIAKLYFSIHPITVGSDNFPEVSNNFSPAVWLEDIAVSVTTETAYEGEHYYQIESDTLIRNGEEYEYKTIVADKINILTAEQKRDENRVMTGYSSVGIANLAKGWKRFVNGYSTVGANEPLQHLTLRERLRLLCGKRRVLEGEFYGYGIKPSHAVINLFDGGTDSYHTITGYSWDVKNRIYNLRLHHLDFPVLTKEVISLKKDRANNGRGNRMYQGASGSVGSGNGGNSGSDSDQQIVLDGPDNYDYTVLKADTSYRISDVGALIQSGHAPELLEAKIIVAPDWITDISIYRGEDIAEADRPEDGILEIHWKGKPPVTGNFQIVVELSTTDGADYLLVIPIRVFPKTVTTATLLDKTSGAAVIVGVIPGLYFVPDISDIAVRFKGTHNQVRFSLVGGGPAGNSISELRVVDTNYQVDDFTYEMFGNEGGFVLPVGSYTFTATSYFENVFRSSEVIKFTLYDEEYLAKYSAELWDTESDELLGVLEPDGSSIYKAPVSFDVKSILSELEHDKVVLTLTKDGVALPEKIYTLPDPELEGEYYFFDEVTTERGPGSYELLADVSLGDTPVYQRLTSWVIADEIVKPIAGIILGSFPANTINFKEIQSLPLNNTEIDLPDNFVLKPSDESGIEFDYISGQLFQNNDGALNEVNVSLYTGLPSFVSFSDPVTESNFPLFRDLNSTDIGSIHKAPSKLRSVYTKRLGGESGKIVEIDQADFAFRVPLEPEDYSGMRYITDNGGVKTVVDANVPKLGRTYILSKYPDVWSISNLEFDGELFDKIRSKAKINLGGVDIVLHLFGSDYILETTLPEPVSVLDEDVSLISGFPDADHLRSCFAPDGSSIIIDQECEIEITVEGYLSGVVIGTKTSRFTLAEEVENPPIEDCCGGGSAELPVYDGVDGTWGDEFKIPKFVLTENGTISSIEEVDVVIPGDEIIDGVHNFDYAPKILFPGTDLDSAATIGQLQSAVAAGSADKTPVKTVATSNIVLASLQNINGYSAVGGDRVLVQNQTDPRENGPYVISPGAWTRAADGDTGTELVGASFLVTAGNADVINTKWKVTNTPPIVLGTDNITIIQTQGSEADPTVPAWVKAITELQPSRWDSAYAVAINFNSLFDARFGSKNTSNLPESSSYLYFTEARVRATPLTGLPAFTNATINEFDSVLSGFSKFQGQLNNANANLSNYVRKDIAGIITANHIFTGTDLTLPSNHYRNLSSNIAGTNYFPLGGNGVNHSFAALRVYDSTTGGTKQLTFGGDGSFQWNGLNVVLETRQVNTGTGLTGGGNLSANRALSVVFGSTAGTVSEGNHTHTFASLTAKPTTLAGYGITDGALTADLTNYVRKDIAAIITADHIFIGTGLTLPNAHYRSLTSNTAYTNYFPLGGNGANNSFASLLVYDASTGGTKTLRFGGDGSFKWNGIDVVLATRSISTGTGLSGGGDFSANRTLSVIFGTSTGTVAEGNHLHSFASLTGKPTTLAGYGITDAASTVDLSSYVKKDVGQIITADHQFTNPNLALPNALYRSLISNTAATNYFPQGGNGGNNSFAALRVYDSSTGGVKTLSFGGDGSFTWNGQNIATETYVNGRGFITASSSNNLTNKTGLLSMWTNDVGFVNTTTLATTLGNYVHKTIGAVISADHQFTNPNLALPNALYRALSSNVAATNYFPQGGNGSSNSFASLRVYDASTGGTKQLTFGGDGSFQWNGLNVATQNWVTGTALSGYATESYVNSRGFITGINSGNVISALGYTPYNASNPAGYITASSSDNLTNKSGNISMWSNNSGYITGINSGMVTGALGYTPYNSSNPNGYISGINSGMVTSALGYTPTGGSGTNGYLPKYTGSLTFGNSIIQDFGSSIQINGALQVNGTINLTGGIASNGQMASGGMLWAIADLRVDGTANLYGNVNISGMLKPTRFRLPRGTEAQMNALSSPEGGEMFYVTSGTGLGVWEYVDGVGWRIFATRVWSSTGVAP